MTSSDGSVWTARSSAQVSDWQSVTWGGKPGSELFVAVGTSGGVMTSPDGRTWTAQTAAAKTWLAVTWGRPTYPKFVAVGVGCVMTSYDGVAWTSRTPGSSSLTAKWQSVTWGGLAGREVFVAVAYNNIPGVMSSSDGINWETHNPTSSEHWSSVVWGGPTA
jgi:hypothetical protein